MTQHDSPMAQARDSATTASPRRVVAIDGPSGTGKSTVARRLAVRLGARYLDTGAMYRAATLAVLIRGIDLGDPDAIAAAVARARIEISTDPEGAAISLDDCPVDTEIRSGAVTAAVSAVSAVSKVRARLVRAQRELIGAEGASAIVVEGRDIGAVVWPSAAPKIYLTASAMIRARRRAGELGPGNAVEAVALDIARRDRLDSTRADSPLSRVEDAIEIDTTYLEIDEVVDRLVDLVCSDSARG